MSILIKGTSPTAGITLLKIYSKGCAYVAVIDKVVVCE